MSKIIKRTVVESIEYDILDGRGNHISRIKLSGKYRARQIKQYIADQLGIHIGNEYQFFPVRKVECVYQMNEDDFYAYAERVKKRVYEVGNYVVGKDGKEDESNCKKEHE